MRGDQMHRCPRRDVPLGRQVGFHLKTLGLRVCRVEDQELPYVSSPGVRRGSCIGVRVLPNAQTVKGQRVRRVDRSLIAPIRPEVDCRSTEDGRDQAGHSV